MKLAQLQKLIRQGESGTVEFKKSTGLLRAAFETVCAFLNGQGGIVLIGVNDKGDLVGQDVTNNTRQEIANELNKIEPPAHPEIYYIPVNKNKSVIAIQVTSNDHAPYTYDGRSFHRQQSTTRKMPQHLYEQLLIARGQLNHSWEEMIAKDYKISDLDHEEIFKTVAEGIRENRIPASAQKDDVEGILKRLRLMEGDYLKNAAVALYAKKESLGFMQCMIKMARFRSTSQLKNFMDNQQILGNCFDLLEAADKFLKSYLPIASTFKSNQFKRIDTPALPIMAVREALINAICHRDYANRSADISLAIFDDCLEIWNCGFLPPNLTLEDLRRRHDSNPRNKLIANVFYVRGYIEKWGSGTIQMIDLCKADGLPEPQFSQRTGGLVVTFKFKEPISPGAKENKNTFTPRQKEILNILRTSSLNSAEITSQLKRSASIRTVQRDLLQLEQMGLIKHEGKARMILWKIVE